MPENRFVGEIARTYDQGSSAEVVGPTVDCLVLLAECGPALEFAIGAGRVAVPLVGRGIAVAGIDISADMLAELRAKPEAAAITAIEGDMAERPVDGEFSLVYLVFNTISNLTTQDEQVACFESAAAISGAAAVLSSKTVSPISAASHPATLLFRSPSATTISGSTNTPT